MYASAVMMGPVQKAMSRIMSVVNTGCLRNVTVQTEGGEG